MSLRQKRHSAAHQEENAERWLITYADMITLLMAFFIMMYAMSVVDVKKFEALAGAMGTAFGGGGVKRAFGGEGPSGGPSLMPGGAGLLDGSMPGEVVGSASLANAIMQQVKENLPEELQDLIEVVHSDNLVTVRLKETNVLFPLGRATLSAHAQRILKEIGSILYEVPFELRIEGHTCDLPIRTYEFPSNWELSATRAANVMAYLIRQARISPLRIAAVGFGDTRPLVRNDSDLHRRRNRRVEIVILSDREPEALAELVQKLRPTPPRPPARPPAPQPQRVEPVPTPIVPPIRLCPRWDVVGTYFGEASGIPSDREAEAPKGLVEEIRPVAPLPARPPVPRPASARKAPANIVPPIQLCPPWDAVGTRSTGPVDQEP